MNPVLTACRGWRYVVTGSFGSKRAGAAWAAGQPGCPAIVDEVLQRQQGNKGLDASAVAELVEIVRTAVQGAILREGLLCERRIVMGL